jgi:site-specific recombinase XerD
MGKDDSRDVQNCLAWSKRHRKRQRYPFVENLKRCAKEAGIGKIHLHQARHTFARMVAERTGSLSETQEALDLPEIEEVEPFYDPVQDEAGDGSVI